MQLQKNPVNVSVVVPGAVATRIFEDANAPGANAATHREIMNQMLTQSGMAPRAAGRIILDGIAAKQFWVSTHPELTAHMAKARAEHLANLTPPAMTDETRQLLGR